MQRVAHIVVDVNHVGVDRDGPAKHFDSLSIFSPALERVAEVVRRLGKIGIQIERVSQHFNRFIVAFQGMQSIAQIVADRRIIRVDLQAVTKHRNGFVGAIQVQEGAAKISNRFDILRLKIDGAAIGICRLLNFPESEQDISKIVMRGHKIRANLEQSAIDHDRFFPSLRRVKREAQTKEGIH